MRPRSVQFLVVPKLGVVQFTTALFPLFPAVTFVSGYAPFVPRHSESSSSAELPRSPALENRHAKIHELMARLVAADPEAVNVISADIEVPAGEDTPHGLRSKTDC
jgi:hypothetical protein